MSARELDWTPPDGMELRAASSWRVFYRKALNAYGVTPEDYRRLYVAQRGRCAICQVARGVHPQDPRARGGRRLGVDHNHVTGAVRGLLCSGGDKTCNRVIGWLDRAALQRAVAYLEYPPAMALLEMKRLEQEAGEAGIVLTPDELDKLAQDFVWIHGRLDGLTIR